MTPKQVKAEVKRILNSKGEFLKKTYHSNFASVGLDIDDFTEAQLIEMVMPDYGPENFYMDGEVSGEQALNIWLKKLQDLGLTNDEIIKAGKMNGFK